MKQIARQLIIQDRDTSVQEIRVVNNSQLVLSGEQSQHHVDNALDTRSDNGLLDFNPYVTSYVCILAPRFEEHLIIGDLSDSLLVWMTDICISFGWRLQFIDIKPEYLHWVISVNINTPSSHFMKIIRRESSNKILDDFPRIREKNMSKDFWAPYQSVTVGYAPYPQRTIRIILEEIRMHQGLR